MNYLYSFQLFENESTRTQELTEDEFITLLKTECSQFSITNDMLYRGCGNVGEYALYKQAERKSTYGGDYHYHKFFNDRKEYPVPRYKSTIGSTSIGAASVLGQVNKALYLVIPYNNSKIIFCPTPDMAAGGNRDVIYTDDMFTMLEYSNNFKINYDKIKDGAKLLHNAGGRKNDINDYTGVEFFTNSNCLLYKLINSKGDTIKSGNKKVQASLDKLLHIISI